MSCLLNKHYYLQILRVPMLSRSQGWPVLMFLGLRPYSIMIKTMKLGIRPTWVQIQLFHSLPMSLLAGFLTAYASVSSFAKQGLKSHLLCWVIRNIKCGKMTKHLAQCLRHSRPQCMTAVLLEQYCLHNQRQSYIHMQKLFLMFPDTFALSTCPSFLPIPFLLVNVENSSFPTDFRGLFWVWQRRDTHRGTWRSMEACATQSRGWAPDNNRKLQHLEVFLAAAGGLCQISLSILPRAAPELWGFANTGTHITAGGHTSSKHLS